MFVVFVTKDDMEQKIQLLHVLPFFKASSLSYKVIMHIFTLVDIQNEKEYITLNQFSIAFHIVTAIAVFHLRRLHW